MLNVYDQNLNQFDFQKIVENGEYTSIAAFWYSYFWYKTLYKITLDFCKYLSRPKTE
jgi:hypothetical protein